MNQKEKIISLLHVNGIMTQGELAEAIYGDKLHSPNIYSALMSLVSNNVVTRSDAHPAKYALSGAPILEQVIAFKKKNLPRQENTEEQQYKAQQQTVTMSAEYATQLILDYFNETIEDRHGRYSVDKWYRLQCDLHWFPDEQPSVEIKNRVEQRLDELGWKVDLVWTHTCPEKYTPREAFLSGINQAMVDNSTEQWLDTIENRLEYEAWYCGHWHINKRIDRMHFLMDSYEEIQPREVGDNG